MFIFFVLFSNLDYIRLNATANVCEWKRDVHQPVAPA